LPGDLRGFFSEAAESSNLIFVGSNEDKREHNARHKLRANSFNPVKSIFLLSKFFRAARSARFSGMIWMGPDFFSMSLSFQYDFQNPICWT
jgi:hypothetical protein